ncbi:MAG: PstS family phosphate ABC transporter substrate-binding protein [Candidatus Omnitrophica bacterium]|nr:PstS family phosphate ABC transporter substrate-binding protein [Candidatus Omnitrophota bacterium]
MKTTLLFTMFLASFLIGVVPANAAMIQVKGSDTIINLVQKEAEVFMQADPSAKIAVTGGGSGTGIAALINGKCDIANSSRTINAKEIETALANNVSPVRIVIAIDGLSVVVHSTNSVSKLTMDQIGAIYRGEIKNWSEVGGANMPISLYGRQSNSGTYGFFREMVLKGEYAQSMKSMNGSSQIAEAVKSDPSGIGYVGVGYAKAAAGLTVVSVAANAGSAYESPLDETAVDNGKYPIARPLYQYVNGTPTGKVKDLIAFELSAQGQQIVAEEGFFVITSEYKAGNAKAGF